jgi:hypothetical protein
VSFKYENRILRTQAYGIQCCKRDGDALLHRFLEAFPKEVFVPFSLKRQDPRTYKNAIGTQLKFLSLSRVVAIEGVPSATMWQFDQNVFRTNRSKTVGRSNLETTEDNIWELGRIMATDLPKIYSNFLLDSRTTITSHDHNFLTAPYLASRMTFDDYDNSTSSIASASCCSDWWYSKYDMAQFLSLHDNTSFATSWNSVPAAPAAPPPASRLYGHCPVTYAHAAQQPPTPQMSDLTGVSDRNDLDTRFATLEAALDDTLDVKFDRFLQAFAAISTPSAQPATLPPPPPAVLPDPHAMSRIPSQPPPVIATPQQPPPPAPNLPVGGDEPTPGPSPAQQASLEQVTLNRLQDQLANMTQLLQEQQKRSIQQEERAAQQDERAARQDAHIQHLTSLLEARDIDPPPRASRTRSPSPELDNRTGKCLDHKGTPLRGMEISPPYPHLDFESTAAPNHNNDVY